MPPAALYSIIAAGGVFLILAFVFACICFRRRKKSDRQTADWYGVADKRFSDSAFGGPGRGPSSKEMKLSDKDSYLENEKQLDADADATVPTHILSKFPKLGKQSGGVASHEKPMEISKPFGMNFHVTNPDFVPTRPPRPSAHFDLSTSPRRVSARQGTEDDDIDEDDEDEDEDAYERNILALTTSMAFDTPRDRHSRAFDASLPLPDSADLGYSMNDGRDTIVVRERVKSSSLRQCTDELPTGLRGELWSTVQPDASTRSCCACQTIAYQKSFHCYFPQQTTSF